MKAASTRYVGFGIATIVFSAAACGSFGGGPTGDWSGDDGGADGSAAANGASGHGNITATPGIVARWGGPIGSHHPPGGSSSGSSSGSSGSSSGSAGSSSGGVSSSSSSSSSGSSSGANGSSSGSSSGGTTSSSSSGSSSSGSSGSGSGSGGSTGAPAGWLYTTGNQIYVSTGSGGTPWMGRGVNADDMFLCGYNYNLWMTNPDTTLETMLSGLVSSWKPNFVRISLGMASYAPTTSWLSNPAQYRTPMTSVVKALGANPGMYVLVTLRSDGSMIGQDVASGDGEATGLPSSSTTTPSASLYPTGTDAVYAALVDTFASDAFVLFGLSNEPGGNLLSNAQISAAMSHAVGVIRAEENRLGVPHHVISVQGNVWTSDISFYASSPLPYDNLVYEVHGYPPAPSSYTYSNIPVIIGEYGSLTNSASFYTDVEAKQISNLAWDFDSYANCAPDLLQTNQSASNLAPTAWGSTVQSYLLAH